MKAAFSLEFNVKDVIRMKKVKLIGTLLAAVIAAAPAAGFTGNVLSFNDNAIVAEAANTPSSITIYDNGKEFRQSNTPILKNGSYDLYYRSNKIEITRTVKRGNVTTITTIKSFFVGGVVLSLQGDGNLVSYGRIPGTPVYHSNTWMYNLSNPKVRFTYQLTNTGVLQIRRNFITGQFAGNSDIVWRSDRNTMYHV